MMISKRYLFLIGLISSIAMNTFAVYSAKEIYLMIPMFHLMMPILYLVGLVILFFINSYILYYFLSIRIATAAWRYLAITFLSIVSVAVLLGLFIGISYALMIKFGFKIDSGMEIWQSFVLSVVGALIILCVQYYLYKRVFDSSVNKTNLKKALVCICFLNIISDTGLRLFIKLNQTDNVVLDELKIVSVQKGDQSNSDLIDASSQVLAKKLGIFKDLKK